MNPLPSAWWLVGALVVGWVVGGLSTWLLLRAGRKEARGVRDVAEEGARTDAPAPEHPSAPALARRACATPAPPPALAEHRHQELSDEEIDALPAELPAVEHAQRRKLPAPRKPVLRNI